MGAAVVEETSANFCVAAVGPQKEPSSFYFPIEGVAATRHRDHDEGGEIHEAERAEDAQPRWKQLPSE